MNLERGIVQAEERTIEVRQWFGELVKTYLMLAPTLGQRSMVVHKRRHTAWVVEVTPGIWKSSGRQTSLDEALFVAWVHDVGRFAQIVDGGRISDTGTGMDHAVISASLVGESGLVIPSKRALVEAVARHSMYEETPGNPAAHCLRDADKVANLLMVDTWVNGGSPSQISDGVMGQLRRRSVVQSRLVRTPSDRIGIGVSWLYGLHYAGTARILLRCGVPGKILDALYQSMGGLDQQRFAEVVELVGDWQQHYPRYLLGNS